MFRNWGLDASIVDAEDLVSQPEAADLLGRRTASIGFLVARGILEPVFLTDGTEGVSRASVQAEVRWRQEASRWQRLL